VIDFLMRSLNAVREPRYEVLNIISIDSMEMVKPWTSHPTIPELDLWRPIQIETGASRTLDPSSLGNEPAPN
jgi:hypothetical protein